MKVTKIFKYIYIGIISLILLVLGIFLFSSLFGKEDYAKVFGYSFFEVKSYSMYPELNKGDLVIVKERDANKYKVDMVVTYKKPTDQIPTTHKIVKIEGNIITTRGINSETNNSDDPPFDVQYIIGEVVGVWKNYDSVREFITNPLGIISILLTGFLIVELINYLENPNKNNKENDSSNNQK